MDYLDEKDRLTFHNQGIRICSADGRISVAKMVLNYNHDRSYLIWTTENPYGLLGRQTSEEEIKDRMNRDALEDKAFFNADFQSLDSVKGIPRIQMGNGKGNKNREKIMFIGEGRYFKILRIPQTGETSDIDEEIE